MHTKTLRLIIIGVVVLAAVYGSFLYRSNLAQVDLVPGETVSLSGAVVSVSNEQVTYDGPYLVTLQPAQGAPVTIAIPSMGLPFCPAYKANNIGDVSLVKPGQVFEARGEVSEHQTVIPCEDKEHYFRPVGIVAPDFEGEADPARMTLGMKSWNWVSATYSDGRTLMPKTNRFSITFGEEGRFSVTTDCNSMGGSYAVGANRALTLSEMFSTKMYCEGSQETEFASLLQGTTVYEFTSKGELVLNTKEGGRMIFR